MNIFSVSEITKYIKQLFEYDAKVSSVFIRGEISNFKKHYSGHCYFTLKDSNATIKAVMFKSRAQFLKFEPKDGMKIIVGGQITVFERDGQYQLYANQLVPDGIGELSLAFAQLKEKLENEGLFADALKKDLPVLPKVVGILTSATGAVIKDIMIVAKRRHPGIVLKLYPVQVQGPEAPMQIVHGIEVFNELNNVDVIIVGRGGGSIEELWAFNDERVVRAIVASKIPIVSAVGHQTDYTLADFAADRRAATPSQAAEFVVPDVRELYKYISTLHNMLESNIRNVLQHHFRRLEQITLNRVFTYPYEVLVDRQQALDNCMQRLEQAIKVIIRDKKHLFTITAEKLAMLNPLAVLARGYSIVHTLDGQVVKSTAALQSGQKIEIVLNRGKIEAEIIHIQEEHHGKS
ncbi:MULTISPECIES: exodeoxyribonuclease VII large subunit [Pelosinus]|uniref:Exodeoxyribonuclease 7 large subunit n=1 Tax=Pelosinus fermentans B4 TaxID=1149862 RepID=I9LDC6_9FIRM|nr:MULTISPECIES: exodeoxyribonuclease VII large subunit [Pelosinus]EIW18439.1 exodeoxyribonuclease VII, large subunit [Pelosinus fermentans B4]EIW24453.1 Exodeoxyribonuclease 7 large subunit [Pelosinus fermentans A11]OAM94489.1 Exodeoxyribonuclease 7 large subunit [Pelosinus fermentans DSM 17108]SDR10444.1 Exodeoxyribonuclease VII large subunit [Pelosinus fermentans]